jgi:hypothetical protein
MLSPIITPVCAMAIFTTNGFRVHYCVEQGLKENKLRQTVFVMLIALMKPVVVGLCLESELKCVGMMCSEIRTEDE